MIVIDRRDHAQDRSNHISRIQPAAESHFQHHGVEASLGEQHESHRRDGLKISRVHIECARGEHSFCGFMNAVKRVGELLWSGRLAQDLNTLGGLNQVRRDVEPGANPGRAQSRFDHRARGPLAVRSSHVHPAARPVWIAKSFEQMSDSLPPQLGRQYLVTQRIKISDRLGVSHVRSAPLRIKMGRAASAKRAVPPTTFSSKIQTDATPGGGTAERIMARIVTKPPNAPAQRCPNLNPLAKIYTNGRNVAMTVRSTKI